MKNNIINILYIYNINRMATLSKELKCIGCEKIFISKQGLEHHISLNICSKRIDRYICEICGLDCKQKSNYEKHKNKKNPCIPKEEKKEEKVIGKKEEEIIKEKKEEKVIEKKDEEIENKIKELEIQIEELKKNNTFLENQNQRYLKREEENEKKQEEKYNKGIYDMIVKDYIDDNGIDYVIENIVKNKEYPIENMKNIKKYRNKIYKRIYERSNSIVPIFDVLGLNLIEKFEKEMNDLYICYNKIEEIFEIPQQIKILNNLSKKMPDIQQSIEIYNKLLEKTEDKQQKKQILNELKKLKA